MKLQKTSQKTMSKKKINPLTHVKQQKHPIDRHTEDGEEERRYQELRAECSVVVHKEQPIIVMFENA